jgi:hypothetical protein
MINCLSTLHCRGLDASSVVQHRCGSAGARAEVNMTTNSGKKRVIALLNAIGDLHEGDLKAVLESDGVVFENLKTLWSMGQNDYICLDEDNPKKIKVVRGSLLDRAGAIANMR